MESCKDQRSVRSEDAGAGRRVLWGLLSVPVARDRSDRRERVDGQRRSLRARLVGETHHQSVELSLGGLEQGEDTLEQSAVGIQSGGLEGGITSRFGLQTGAKIV